MPPANAIQKKRSFEPIDTYLHLLSGNTPTPENWNAAAELIAAGMATGQVHRSSTTAAGEIDALVAFAPTLQGRLYAQQLQENKRARGVIGRLQKYVLVLLGWVGGVLSAAFADLLLEAAKRGLGWRCQPWTTSTPRFDIAGRLLAQAAFRSIPARAS